MEPRTGPESRSKVSRLAVPLEWARAVAGGNNLTTTQRRHVQGKQIRSSRWFLFRGGQPSFYYNRVTTEFSAPSLRFYIMFVHAWRTIYSLTNFDLFLRTRAFVSAEWIFEKWQMLYIYISNHGVTHLNGEWNFAQLSRKLRNVVCNKSKIK